MSTIAQNSASASAVSVERNMRPERVDLILSQIEQLPTLPEIAVRVLQATTRDDTSAHDVVKLIESDQSLSAQILKMVGCASLGVSRDVETIDKAVTLLGFDAIRHAVLTIKVFDVLASIEGKNNSQFDRTEFWKHSLAVASAAHLIAERWPGHIDPEVAFMCGLLHDIGKVALDVCLPKSYDRVVSVAKSRHSNILDIEQELLGVDHTIAGKRLAQRWKLPASVYECIWLHHHTPDILPDSVSNPDLVQIINLANTWVQEQRLGFSGFAFDRPTSTEIATQMGMPLEHLSAIAPQLLEKIEERAELLGLDKLTSGRMFAQAVANINSELGRVSQDLMRTRDKLEAQSHYLATMEEFNSAIHSESSLGDICQAAAKAARSLLRLPSVAVFTTRSEARMLYVGLADEKGTIADVLPICGEDPQHDGWEHVAAHAMLMNAPPSTQGIQERFSDRLGTGTMRMLPIFKDNHLWGGVLCSIQRDAAEWVKRMQPELVLFASSLSMVMISGHKRLQEERLSESLARVNRQLKAAQSELLRRRSLAMVAEMAAGAAHELNNPLAVIAGRGQLLVQGAENEQDRKNLNLIVEHAQRASNIVNELMSFAKPAPPARQRFSLTELLEELVHEWVEKSSLKASQVALEISDDPLELDADAAQIKEAFEELIKNAIDAMSPESAQLVINCQRYLTDEKIVVAVTDNGCGMTSEVLEKAPDPFFSHKSAGRSRGLGLSRATRWVEINGGRLRIESRPNEGTTAWVELSAS